MSLQLFATVVEAGSIAKAAEREHIAPSALSRRIADLEEAVGTALLQRTQRGVVPTDAGRAVYEYARKMSGGLETLLAELDKYGQEVRGTIRIAANLSSIVGYLPEALSGFRGDYPQVRIELEEKISDEVLRAIRIGEADLGACAGRADEHGLQSRAFREDRLVLAVPPGHALDKAGAIDFSHTLDHDFVGLQPGGATDQLLTIAARGAKQDINRVINVGSFDSVCRMVAAGMGVAVMPESAGRAFRGAGRFRLRPLTDPWARYRLFLYALDFRRLPRAGTALVEFLTATA